MVGAAAAFWILSLFCKQEHVNHQGYAENLLCFGCFALVFNQGVFDLRLSMTSPIDASIVTTLPIVTMVVAAIYLKEPITNKKVMGIFIGAMGALILIS